MKQKLIWLTMMSIVGGIALWHESGGGGAGLLYAQPAAGAKMVEADRDAIVKAARDFAAAFNKADAKAIAAMWTENGESREASGQTFVGREAIEKAYAEFFKAHPSMK